MKYNSLTRATIKGSMEAEESQSYSHVYQSTEGFGNVLPSAQKLAEKSQIEAISLFIQEYNWHQRRKHFDYEAWGNHIGNIRNCLC